MGELTGLSILILLGFGALFFLLVLVSHALWWSKGKYFPSKAICDAAHDRLHLSDKTKSELASLPAGVALTTREKAEERFWHDIAIHMLAQVPSELSVSGFFSAIVWPVFVLLNVLLLAQVVGTMVGMGGGVIDINPFGTYSAIPLVTAVLYAVAQSVFGIMYGEMDKKDKKRYLVLALLLLAILLEGGLAVYRAWLIAQGNPDVHPGDNMIDNFLGSRFGLVVGGFFGILFPAAHAALGYVGFPQFVRPVIRYAFHAAGGACVLFIALASYLLLAWHPIHPKDDPKRDDQEVAKWIENEVEKRTKEGIEEWKQRELPGIIDEAIKKSQEEHPPAPSAPPPMPDDLSKEEEQRWTQVARLRDEAKELATELETFQVRLPVNPQTIIETLAEAERQSNDWFRIARHGKQLAAEASKLDPDKLALRVASFEEQHRPEDASSEEPPAAQVRVGDVEAKQEQAVLEKAIAKGKMLLGPLYVLANAHDKLVSALNSVESLRTGMWERAQSEGKALLKQMETQRQVFAELVDVLRTKEIGRPGMKQEKLIELRDGTLNRLKKNFSELERPDFRSPLRLDFDTLEGLIEKCGTLMRDIESVTVPTGAELQAMKRNLENKPKELTRAYLGALKLLDRTEGTIKERIERVEGRPRWFYRLADLVA